MEEKVLLNQRHASCGPLFALLFGVTKLRLKEESMRFDLRNSVVAASLIFGVSAASAAGYCTLGTAGGSITKTQKGVTTVTPFSLAREDVKFEDVRADDCYGTVDLANENTATIETGANAISSWGNGWEFLVRDASSGGSGSSGAFATTSQFAPYSFTLTANNGQSGNPTPESWTLTVTGDPIPFQMDFLVYMHAGDAGGAYYLFNDREIQDSNTGTFSITFLNNGGNFPGLSGISLLGRDVQEAGCTSNCNPSIPEPASLVLAGLALAGLGVSRRRKARSGT